MEFLSNFISFDSSVINNSRLVVGVIIVFLGFVVNAIRGYFDYKVKIKDKVYYNEIDESKKFTKEAFLIIRGRIFGAYRYIYSLRDFYKGNTTEERLRQAQDNYFDKVRKWNENIDILIHGMTRYLSKEASKMFFGEGRNASLPSLKDIDSTFNNKKEQNEPVSDLCIDLKVKHLHRLILLIELDINNNAIEFKSEIEKNIKICQDICVTLDQDMHVFRDLAMKHSMSGHENNKDHQAIFSSIKSSSINFIATILLILLGYVFFNLFYMK